MKKLKKIWDKFAPPPLKGIKKVAKLTKIYYGGLRTIFLKQYRVIIGCVLPSTFLQTAEMYHWVCKKKKTEENDLS